MAFSHQVVMKGQDSCFDAFMQILKALNYRDIEDSKLIQEQKRSTVGPAEIIIPLVVFDGEIFGCYCDKGKLEVTKLDFIRSVVHGLPSQRIPALIDVVTLDYFPKYLELLDKELPLHNNDLKEVNRVNHYQ